MTRQQLIDLYIDYINNFLTTGGFAEHFGLHDFEAETLLAVARSAYTRPHPDA